MKAVLKVIKGNVASGAILLLVGALFVAGQAQVQKPKKNEKAIVVLKIELDSMEQEQRINRRDINVLLATSKEIHEHTQATKNEVSEIKGMLKVLLEMKKQK